MVTMSKYIATKIEHKFNLEEFWCGKMSTADTAQLRSVQNLHYTWKTSIDYWVFRGKEKSYQTFNSCENRLEFASLIAEIQSVNSIIVKQNFWKKSNSWTSKTELGKQLKRGRPPKNVCFKTNDEQAKCKNKF